MERTLRIMDEELRIADRGIVPRCDAEGRALS
jgi:hypothetical protein